MIGWAVAACLICRTRYAGPASTSRSALPRDTLAMATWPDIRRVGDATPGAFAPPRATITGLVIANAGAALLSSAVRTAYFRLIADVGPTRDDRPPAAA
jgi:hypothetical protein